MQEHWSLKQYKNYKQNNKYKNEKVVSDGIKFDSKKEEQRWQELKLLENQEMIRNLRRQVRFELQPSYKKNGKTIRGIYYVADFVYGVCILGEGNKLIVEDTKRIQNRSV